MSELRWNPILEEWVATATHRQDRTFLPPDDYCPLCPTQKGGFPTEVPRDHYEMAVFENKFPSFKQTPPAPAVEGSELYQVRPSLGICEVVLYTPNHATALAELPLDDFRKLVMLWTDRYRELGKKEFVDYVFIFENKGEAIGVTLHHPHGQIYAFSYIPPKIQRELDAQRKHWEAKQTCLHCDVLLEEQKSKSRIVAENDSFVAFVPFYARYPYELHLYSKDHRASLLDFSPKEQQDLARLLKIVLSKYDNLFSMPFPYMMVMHQAPTDGKTYPGCHFHLEFYPPLRTQKKLKYLAGCESGAGTFINDTLPEEKAAELRAVAPFSP
ncbi:MAG: galactose-1-phosphate uridylyltransferase [Bacteroidota bacterium]